MHDLGRNYPTWLDPKKKPQSGPIRDSTFPADVGEICVGRGGIFHFLIFPPGFTSSSLD
jgi:hypothetical protein